MIITLTIIALLIQFAGAYALLIHAQRAQDAGGEVAEPANQRGHQAYYDAFGEKHGKSPRGRRAA
jgi:hypothetical protein